MGAGGGCGEELVEKGLLVSQRLHQCPLVLRLSLNLGGGGPHHSRLLTV